MKIDIEFKYRTDSAPVMAMSAYDINDQAGLQKVIAVLAKLGEAMEVCNPKPKEKINDKHAGSNTAGSTERGGAKDSAASNKGVN